MRISIILFIFTCIHFCGYSQAITVSNINVTGRFTSCNGSNTPVITASLINSPGASVVGGVFTCTNPCDSSTIRVNMSNIKWNQTPNNEWLHGLYLPANNGFTVSPVVLPAGFITYNPGCVGNCPSGSGTNGGPGFYFDNTTNNSCCGTNPVNDGYPCNNYGDVSITCNSPLSLSFDIKFCNSMITSTAYIFSFHGTSDGETGCWNVNDNGLHTINFTITTNACTIIPISPVASSPIRTCVGNVENYTSTLTGTCAANTLSWWDAPVGGTLVGTGSPFNYDPAGSACPAGTTLYATCCTGNSTSCISRVPITIPGNCNPLAISAINTINSTCLLLGSITSINVQNAVGTITYTLNPSGASNTTGIFTGLNQPSYTCTVTDATGCTASSIVLITQVSTIAFDTLSTIGVTCASPNIGSLSVSTTGGSGIITYSISPSATQNPVGTFTGLSAQVYTVIATDANACSVSTIITITSSALPTWDSVTTSPTSCISATGSILCNAMGGSGNFTYTILPSGTSNATGIFSSLINGNYTITAMDAAGCTVSTIAVVTLPTLIIFTFISSDSTTCFGSNDGSISVVTSGGMGTISYTLLPGNIFSSNGNFTNLNSGIYTIVALDSYGCTSSTIANVLQPNSITFSSSNIVAPLCHTSLDGSISIAAIGGTGIITYNLNPGNLTNTNGSFNGLGSGVYTITASDIYNCTSTTIVNIIAPNSILISSVNVVNNNCNGGSNGSIQVTATGGTGLITYLLMPNNVSNTTGLFINLSANNYTVTASDMNGCSISTVVVITEPNALSVSLSATSILCHGGTSTITATGLGGTGLYQYQLNTNPFQNGNIFANQTAGMYTITIKDANNCTATSSINFTEPNMLSVSLSASNILCHGGTSTITATGLGGTGLYQYQLNANPFQSGNVFNNLSAGVYTITIKDANNCTATSSINITEPNVLSVSLSASTILCNGGTSTITAIGNGGTTNYQYQLNAGPFQNGNTFTNQTAGTYTVTIQDANNCTATSSIILTEPTSLLVSSLSSTIPSCVPGNDAVLTITANGGIPAYTYSIGGTFQSSPIFSGIGTGTYTITVQDANACSVTSTIAVVTPNAPTFGIPIITNVNCFGGNNASIQVSANGGTGAITYTILPINQTNATGLFINLSANTYTINATDANACSTNTQIIITQPTAVAVTLSATTILCHGGTSTITATGLGGTGLYQYQLNANPFQSGNVFTNLSAGVYTVTIKDANNCTATSSINITEPIVLGVSLSAFTILCNGGTSTITATGNGGTINYQYQLNAGPFQNGNTFTNQTAGTYTVTIQDANNCTASSSIILTEPAPLLISNISSTIPSCVPGNDAVLTITASGGIPAYTYSIGGTFQNSPIFTGIGTGTYTITVQDANACSVTSTISVVTPNTPSITSVLLTSISCFPGADGSATITAIGGIGAYTFSTDGINFQSSPIFNGLSLGTYTVLVKDANGCTGSSIITTTMQASPSITAISLVAASCNPGCDGSASITASGGASGIFTYSLDNITFQSSALFTNLCSNIYTVIVKDANGCTASSIFNMLTSNGPTIMNSSHINVSCFGGNNGSLAVTATGGIGNLLYTIQPNGQSNANGIFSNLIANNYTLTVSDSNGCSVNTTIAITEPNALQFTNVITSAVTCYGANNGNINFSIQGGTPNIIYSINPAGLFTPPNLYTNLVGNITYTILATDANGCTQTTTAFIAEPLPIIIDTFSAIQVTCNGLANGAIFLQAINGTGSLNYTLLPLNINSTTGQFSGLLANTYTVVVSDANNCSISTIVNITEPSPILLNNINGVNISCNNNNDGSIQLNCSGGSGVLQYNLQPGNIVNGSGIFTGLSANNYTITVSDVIGCNYITSVTISNPPVLQFASVVHTTILCNGASNASISAVAIGGTGSNYTYSITPQNASNNNGLFTGLLANNFTVTATDVNNCSITTTVNITQSLPLIGNILNTQNESCFNAQDGQISVNAIGGTAPYTYVLSPSGISNVTGIFTNLSSNNYSILITDSNLCTTTIGVIPITSPPAIVWNNITHQNITCYGQNTGGIQVLASGGMGSINYVIQPAIGTQTTSGNFTNLVAGTYTIIATDAITCSQSTVVQITQNPEIHIIQVGIQEPICYRDGNGVIDILANGGTGILNYQINLNSPQLNGHFVNLQAGMYTISIHDSLGCTKDTVVEITQPEPIHALSLNIYPILCEGINDGKIIVVGAGGRGNYVYSLKPGFGINSSGVFNNLQVGTYTLTIKDSAGCIFDTTVSMTSEFIPFSSSFIKQDLSCFGKGNEGWAEAQVQGGIVPFTYLWNSDPPQNTQRAFDLFFGKYIVEITDAHGCSIHDTVTIDPGPCCDEVFVPNAFSPNGDGVNDVFKITTSAGIDLIRFEVFDRWGERIWSTADFRNGWDGNYRNQQAQVGTYYYLFWYNCLTDGEKHMKKGDLILIR